MSEMYKCDMCDKEFTDDPPKWRFGDAMAEGPKHLKSFMFVQGLDKTIETDETNVHFCGLMCFCKYGVKISVVNHDQLGLEFADMGSFLGTDLQKHLNK